MIRKLQAPLTAFLILFSFITGCQKQLDSDIQREQDPALDVPGTVSTSAVATKYIKVNIFGGSNGYSNAEWNNWNTFSSLSSGNLSYSDGSSSTISAELSTQSSVSDNGSSYSMNMAPSEVGRYASYSNANRSLTITGLDDARIYEIEIYASRNGVSGNTTRFTTSTQTVDVVTDNNADQKASFSGLTSASGRIVVNLSKLKSYNYINGFMITETGSSTSGDTGGDQTTTPPPATTGTRFMKVNLFGGSNAFNNTEWNNWNTYSSKTSSNFKFSDGSASSIKAVISAQNAVSDNSTSFTTTMAPKEVGRYASYSNSNRTLTISGLDNSKTYGLELYASRKGTSNNTTRFTVGSTSVDVLTDDNLDRKASFTNLSPVSGQIVVSLTKLNTYNYLNGFMLTENGSTGGTTNQAPSANAGADKVMTLPVNSTQLTGSGSDADGTIASYSWTRVSGPSQFSISSTTVASPSLSNLVAGTYIFRLAVTDNSGATATDDVNVVVNSSTSTGGLYRNHTLQFDSYGNAYYPNALGLDWAPGDTVNIPAGNYGLIDLGNIKGDATRPIIIRNKGGLVTLTQIRLSNKMEYFKIMGNGHPGITYGIKIQNASNIAVAAAMVSDMELAYIEVAGAGVGIMVKKNPDAGDPSTHYPNYTIKNIRIHHNYLHDIETEGMYIGSTMPQGDASGIPIRLQNVEIYNNTLERIGWDGIQMSTTVGTNSIHDNVIRNFGTVNHSSQQTGIAIGGAATGSIYNNTIVNGTGWGINAMGYGQIRITNNYIESVGANGIDKGAESIFADDRISGPESFPKQEIIISNNTIKFPQPDGAIRVGAYNNNSLPSTITNNTVYLPNAASNWLNFYIVSNAIGSLISGNTVVR